MTIKPLELPGMCDICVTILPVPQRVFPVGIGHSPFLFTAKFSVPTAVAKG